MIATHAARTLARLAAALLILHAAAEAARAGLVIEVANVTASPGSTGSFDVLLTNTDASNSFHVAGDSFQLKLSGIAGVQFTAATIATTTAYIYQFSATTGPLGSPLSSDPFPNTSFTASDGDSRLLGYRLVGSGATFGLAHVTYSVATTASGVGTLSFLDLGGATSLSDENGTALAFATQGGTFTVTAAGVPEPASFGLVLLAAACATGARRAARPRPRR